MILIRLKTLFALVLIVLSCKMTAQSPEWAPAGMPLYGRQVRCIYNDTISNVLYVTGEIMATTTSFATQFICKYDGSSWSTIGIFNGQVLSVAHYNGDLVVAGFFTTINSVPIFSIARYNGSTWFPMGNFDLEIFRVKVINTDLYALGSFNSVDGVSAKRVAKWNGIIWSDVNGFYADTMDGLIYDIAIYNGNTYVGGNFVNTPLGINHLAVYKGGIWQNVGGGILGGLAEVVELVEYKNELYTAGVILKSAGNTGHGIQKWNDTIWSEVGAGVQDLSDGFGFTSIRDMTTYNNELYVTGGFGYAGHVPATFIAKWNGLKWCGFATKDLFTMGAGAQIGSAVGFYNDTMYLAIGNDTLNGVSTNRILKYLAGSYNDTCSINFTGINNLSIENEINLYPNPSTNQITIEFELSETKNVSIEIKNVLGQTIKIFPNSFSIGNNKIEIDVAEFSNGVYFIQLQTGNKVSNQKFIKH